MPREHPLTMAMRALRVQLESDFELSAAIDHNPSVGYARERSVIALLEKLIPSRFTVATGVAVNVAGDTSQQLDVMVLDSTIGRPFVHTGGVSVAPVELVHACLQVKSSVSPSNIAEGVTNIASFLGLFPQARRDELPNEQPFTAIVAFEASGNSTALFEAFVRANLCQPRHKQTQCLLVPGRILIYMGSEVGERDEEHPYGSYAASPPERAHYWVMPEREGDESTLFFYLLLTASLASYTSPAFSPWTYAVSAELLTPGQVRFWDRYGKPEDVTEHQAKRRAWTPAERATPRDLPRYEPIPGRRVF